MNKQVLLIGLLCATLSGCGGGGGGGNDGSGTTPPPPPPPPPNTAPVASDDNFTTDQDQSLTITAAQLLTNDTDADGDALVVASVAQPANGTLQTASATSWTYTPAAGFFGTDTFSYTISDGTATDTGTVTITVNEVAPPPPPPPPPDASVGGIWSGQFASSEGGVLSFTGLVAETGEFRWLDNDQGQQIFGTIQVAGTSFSSTDAISALPLGATTVAGSRFGVTELQGTVNERVSLAGNFTTVGDQGDTFTGTFSFAYDDIYERPSSLAVIQGTYTTADDSLAIDANGQVFYQSSTSQCVANGAVEVIDASFNVYRVTLEVDSCQGALEARNGQVFGGLAYLKDSGAGATNDTLEFAVSAERAADYLIWRYEAQR